MNIGLNFRDALEGLPAKLEAMVARINTVWKKQHNADGTHGDVTMSGDLVVDGDVSIDGGLVVDGVPITGGGGGAPGPPGPVGPMGPTGATGPAGATPALLETFLTQNAEATLANHRRLVASTNITFDVATAGQLKIAATGGTPAAHATTHQPGGADPMAVDAAAATGSLRTLGTGANQAAAGNDARFAAGTAAHAPSHKSGGADAIKLDELAAPTDITTLNASTAAHGLLKKLSNVATQFMDGQGNWTVPATGAPGAHGSSHLPAGGDPIPNIALKNVDNLFSADQTIQKTSAQLWLRDTSAGVDKKLGKIVATADTLNLEVRDDASTGVQGRVRLFRDGKFQADGAIQGTSLVGTPLGAGSTVPDANLSANVALRNIDNVFSAVQTLPSESRIVGPNGQFWMRDTTAPVNSTVWRFLGYSNGHLYLEALFDPAPGIDKQFAFARDGSFGSGSINTGAIAATTVNASGNVNAVHVVPSGNVQAGGVITAGNYIQSTGAHVVAQTNLYALTGGLLEQSRAVQAGHWIGVAHNAANFYGLAPMTWTVVAGSQYGNTYTLIGNTAMWTVYLVNVVFGGSPSAAVYINLPAGLGAGIQSDGSYCEIYEPGAGWIPGSVNVEVGNSRVILAKYNKTAYGLGTGHIRFSITFRIA